MGIVQQEEIERVGKKIGAVILRYYQHKLSGAASDFHMEDLVTYVQTTIPSVAPDSASRILRNLRTQGELNYEVLSRTNSHYRMLPLSETNTPQRRHRVLTPMEKQQALLELQELDPLPPGLAVVMGWLKGSLSSEDSEDDFDELEWVCDY